MAVTDGPLFAALTIEGGVCAGKTTLSSALRSKGLFVVPEYMDWITEKGISPPTGSRLSRFRGYLKIDEDRAAYIRNIDRPTSIIERSIITILSYELCVSQLRNLGSWAARLSELKARNVIWPQRILMLTCDRQTRRSRWRERGFSSRSIFLKSEMDVAFESIVNSLSHLIPVRYVDTSDLSIDAAVSLVIELLETPARMPLFEEYIDALQSI